MLSETSPETSSLSRVVTSATRNSKEKATTNSLEEYISIVFYCALREFDASVRSMFCFVYCSAVSSSPVDSAGNLPASQTPLFQTLVEAMASPLPSPAIPILAPPSAVQLVSKQLAAHIDALRAARLHFAQGVADLASRDGFFAATVPSSSSSSNANNQSIQQQQPPANAILDLLRPMLVSDPSPPVAAAAVSCLARIMQAASSGTLTSDKKQTRGKAWAESIVLGGEVGRGTVKAVVGIVEGSVQMVEEGSARKSGRAHGEDHAATLVGFSS